MGSISSLIFLKIELSLVWFDALSHGESEYSLGFYFWPCFSEINIFQSYGKKTCFDGFYHLKYFEHISAKTKAFRNFFLIKMLRIKSSTNFLNFIKIWNYFLYTVVEILRKYPPTNGTFSFPTVFLFAFLTPPRN